MELNGIDFMKQNYKIGFSISVLLFFSLIGHGAQTLYIGKFAGNAFGVTNSVGNMIRAELFGVTPYRTNPPAALIGSALQIPSNLPDQTAALQNVINIAASTTNLSQEFCTVRLPWGVYRFTSTLRIPDKVRIAGEGGLYHSTSEGGAPSRIFNTPPYTILWCSDTNADPAIMMTNSTTGWNILKNLEICGGTNCLAGLGILFNDANGYESLPSSVLGAVGLRMGKVFGGGTLLEDVGVCGFRIGVDFIGGNALTFRRSQWPGNDVGFQCTNASGVVDSLFFEQCGAGCRAGGIQYVMNNARDVIMSNPNDIDGFCWGQLWNTQLIVIGGNSEYHTPLLASAEVQPSWCYTAQGAIGNLVATNGWWSQNQQGGLTPGRIADNFGIFNCEVDYNVTSSQNSILMMGTRISSSMTNHLYLVKSTYSVVVCKTILINPFMAWPLVSGNFIVSDDNLLTPLYDGRFPDSVAWQKKDANGNLLETIPIVGYTTNMFVLIQGSKTNQMRFVGGKLISVSPFP